MWLEEVLRIKIPNVKIHNKRGQIGLLTCPLLFGFGISALSSLDNMVESLKELNRICQKPRYKEVGNWMVRHILRDAALPITWLLLHTPVTANQVTLASLLVGLWGIFLMVFSAKGLFLLGALLLQTWYLLDHVDGQIARYRGTACLTGRFFDFLTHHIIHGVVFFALGFYCFHKTGFLLFILWGFLTALSMWLFNLIQDTKYKTFFEKLLTLKNIEIVSREHLEATPLKDASLSSLKQVFILLHKMSEMHVLMNVLTLAALFQSFVKSMFDLRLALFVIYGVIVPTIAIVKVTYIISNRKIDQEFEDTFK